MVGIPWSAPAAMDGMALERMPSAPPFAPTGVRVWLANGAHGAACTAWRSGPAGAATRSHLTLFEQLAFQSSYPALHGGDRMETDRPYWLRRDPTRLSVSRDHFIRDVLAGDMLGKSFA